MNNKLRFKLFALKEMLLSIEQRHAEQKTNLDAFKVDLDSFSAGVDAHMLRREGAIQRIKHYQPVVIQNKKHVPVAITDIDYISYVH
jgi:hypothetical protein